MRLTLAGIIVVGLFAAFLPSPRPAHADPSPAPSSSALPCYNQFMPNGLPTEPPGAEGAPLPPDPNMNDPAIQQAINEGYQEAQSKGFQTPEPTPANGASPGPTSSPSCPPLNISGNLQQKIWTAASNLRGQSTAWPGTACGSYGLGGCACAAAVSYIVQQATGSGAMTNYAVDVWRDYATSGKYGGGIVDASQAKAGAIIIWPTSEVGEGSDAHIGICANDGCTQTWSNSSEHAEFAPYTSDITFGGAFTSWLIWEPDHLP